MMISTRLVAMIEDHADQLTAGLVNDLRQHPREHQGHRCRRVPGGGRHRQAHEPFGAAGSDLGEDRGDRAEHHREIPCTGVERRGGGHDASTDRLAGPHRMKSGARSSGRRPQLGPARRAVLRTEHDEHPQPPHSVQLAQPGGRAMFR